MRKTKEKERSAGFIIVRKNLKSWEVLGLLVYGKFDIPKGHLNEGETDFEAALRECREEAGIEVTESDMLWGHEHFVASRPHKDVVIFLASTDQDPVIRKNPETNRFEHDAIRWLSWDKIREKSYPYLRDAFSWAESKVEGHS